MNLTLTLFLCSHFNFALLGIKQSQEQISNIYYLTSPYKLSGNILIIVAIISSKMMQNATNIFLASLAIADLFVVILCCPAMVSVQIKYYIHK